MPPDNFNDLPGVLREVAEAAGREAAELIAEARGGSRVYFPPSDKLRSDHWIVVLIGADRAVKVSEAIADPIGVRVDVPFGPASQTRQTSRSRIAVVLSMTLDGESATSIARHLSITDRSVRLIRERLRRSGELSANTPSPASVGPRAKGQTLIKSPKRHPRDRKNSWYF